MTCFCLDIRYEQTVTCYIEAESQADIDAFLEENPDWQPGDVEGLIDIVSPQTELDYTIAAESVVTPGYRLTGAGTLEEIQS